MGAPSTSHPVSLLRVANSHIALANVISAESIKSWISANFTFTLLGDSTRPASANSHDLRFPRRCLGLSLGSPEDLSLCLLEHVHVFYFCLDLCPSLQCDLPLSM